MQLLFADVRRRAAAEVCKAQLPSLQCGRAAVDFHLFDEGVEISANLISVLVRVDFEVAKLAALATKRNVEIKPQRFVNARRWYQRLHGFGHEFRFPLGERWIIRKKISADFRTGIGRHKSVVRKNAVRSVRTASVRGGQTMSGQPLTQVVLTSSRPAHEIEGLHSDCQSQNFGNSPKFRKPA